MGNCILKIRDKYCEWSSIVDAPVSYFVGRYEAMALWGEERIERADLYGHSYRDGYRPALNRAGPNESELTDFGMLVMYAGPDEEAWFRKNGVPPSWIVKNNGN